MVADQLAFMETPVAPSALVARCRRSLAVRRAVACAALVGTVLLVAFGLTAGLRAEPTQKASWGGDLEFYERVIKDVRSGKPYEQAAMDEIRSQRGAVKPFMTIRPPLLAELMGMAPDTQARILAVRLLASLVLIIWFLRLTDDPAIGLLRWPLLAALSTGVAMACAPQAYLMHEVWAGLLMALSLALRTPKHWLASVVVGTLAAVLRELAAPFLLAMAAMAFLERRPREGGAWLTGLTVFAVTLAGHAAAVQALLLPTDTAAPGWVKFGGWPFVLHAANWNLVSLVAPARTVGCVFPLALLGLAAWRDALGRRVALVVTGYVLGFLFVGRDGNAYWGLLIAPLWPLGVALAPQALAWIWRTLAPDTVQTGWVHRLRPKGILALSD